MGSSFEQAKAAALAAAAKYKVKNVKIPDPKASYAKFSADMARLSKEYDTALDQLQAKVTAMQQQCGTIRPALKMYQDQIDKNNFGIDPKSGFSGGGPGNGEQAIDAIRGTLDKFLDEKLQTVDALTKSLEALEKKTVDIEKFDAET